MPKKKPESKRTQTTHKKNTDAKVASNRSRYKTDRKQSPYAGAMAARLELLAKRAGSKAKLDHLLGVGRGTIASYTRAPCRIPGGEMLFNLCNATGCDPGWLLTGRGEPFSEDRGEHLNEMRDRLAELMAALDTAIESTDSF